MAIEPFRTAELPVRTHTSCASCGLSKWGEVAGVSETTTTDANCAAQDPSIGQTQIFERKPVLWLTGHVHELPTVGDDPDGTALAIHDKGVAAGTTGTCGPFNIDTYISVQPVHAVLWKAEGLSIGYLPGGTSGGIALGLNNRNDVVGGSFVENNTTSHGFLWTPETGKMQDLPPIGSDFLSTAIGINDLREAIGVSIGATTMRATLWREGVPTDLNTLVANGSSLYLIIACSINERGQIIGLAIDPNTNGAHGYLATPRWRGDDALSKPV